MKKMQPAASPGGSSSEASPVLTANNSQSNLSTKKGKGKQVFGVFKNILGRSKPELNSDSKTSIDNLQYSPQRLAESPLAAHLADSSADQLPTNARSEQFLFEPTATIHQSITDDEPTDHWTQDNNDDMDVPGSPMSMETVAPVYQPQAYMQAMGGIDEANDEVMPMARPQSGRRRSSRRRSSGRRKSSATETILDPLERLETLQKELEEITQFHSATSEIDSPLLPDTPDSFQDNKQQAPAVGTKATKVLGISGSQDGHYSSKPNMILGTNEFERSTFTEPTGKGSQVSLLRKRDGGQKRPSFAQIVAKHSPHEMSEPVLLSPAPLAKKKGKANSPDRRASRA